MISVDNGAEFTSKALDQWAYWNHVTLDFSRPGKPTDNAHIEVFNRSLRRECRPAASRATLVHQPCRRRAAAPRLAERVQQLQAAQQLGAAPAGAPRHRPLLHPRPEPPARLALRPDLLRRRTSEAAEARGEPVRFCDVPRPRLRNARHSGATRHRSARHVMRCVVTTRRSLGRKRRSATTRGAQSARCVTSASPCSAICTAPSSRIAYARRWPSGPVHQRADGRTTGESSVLPLLASGDAAVVNGSDGVYGVYGVDGRPAARTARAVPSASLRPCVPPRVLPGALPRVRPRARGPRPSGCPRRIASRNKLNACVGWRRLG
jgi:hypothetical protein